MTCYAVVLDGTEDLIIEDPALTLDLLPGWAYFSDPNGIAIVIPAGRIHNIRRLDEAPPAEEGG